MPDQRTRDEEAWHRKGEEGHCDEQMQMKQVEGWIQRLILDLRRMEGKLETLTKNQDASSGGFSIRGHLIRLN